MGMAFQPKKSNFGKPSDAPAQPNKGMEGHQSGAHEDGQGQDISHMAIHEAVEQHGPAHKIDIAHEPQAGKHHVESHHGKHTHKSDHGSMDEAHQHAKAAAGEGGEQEHSAPPMSAPGMIPGMSE